MSDHVPNNLHQPLVLVVGRLPIAADALARADWTVRACESDDIIARMTGCVPAAVVAPPALTRTIRDFDALLPVIDAADEASIADRAAVWHPQDRMAAAFRLIDLFGASALLPSYLGLAAQLRDQLAAHDPGDHAHRIAGLAGTLGFTALGEEWRAVSEGDLASLPLARRESQIVALAIGAAFGPRAPGRTGPSS